MLEKMTPKNQLRFWDDFQKRMAAGEKPYPNNNVGAHIELLILRANELEKALGVKWGDK